MPTITYVKAIIESLHQVLAGDERVLLIGQGVTSPWYVGMTTEGLIDRFGDKRVIDTPVSENGITGVAVGAALAGMRPILLFPRMDFMYYAMDQIANHAANWHYMFGGQSSVCLLHDSFRLARHADDSGTLAGPCIKHLCRTSSPEQL